MVVCVRCGVVLLFGRVLVLFLCVYVAQGVLFLFCVFVKFVCVCCDACFVGLFGGPWW